MVLSSHEVMKGKRTIMCKNCKKQKNHIMSYAGVENTCIEVFGEQEQIKKKTVYERKLTPPLDSYTTTQRNELSVSRSVECSVLS